MKTTVDLPDDLVIAAKQRAAELRQPLRALIERGLRAELGRSTVGRAFSTAPRADKKLRVGRPFRSFGGLIEELMHLDASLAENCP